MEQIKLGVFETYFHLLNGTEVSQSQMMIISMIQFFQMLAFIFHKGFLQSWGKPQVAEHLTDTLEYLTIMKYLEGSSWFYYRVSVQLSMFYIFVILCNIFFVAYVSIKKVSGLLAGVQSLRLLIWITTQVLYMPLFHLLINIIRCEYNDEGDLVHYLFRETYCYSGEHLMQTFHNFFAGFSLFIIAWMTAYFNFERSL